MSDPNALVSWYRLDEASGGALDVTGRNPGTYQGGVTRGGAAGITLNGSTGYVSVPDAASLDLGDTWALAAIVKVGALGAVRALVSKGQAGPYMRINATGNVELWDSGVQLLATSSTALVAGTTYVVVGMKTGASARICINGGVQTFSPSHTSANTALPLTIGRDTAAAGTGRDFSNATILEAGVFGAYFAGPIVVPLVTASPAIAFCPMPDLATTYVDPGAMGTIYGQLPVFACHGGSALTTLHALVVHGPDVLLDADVALASDYTYPVRFPLLPLGSIVNGATLDVTLTGGSVTQPTVVTLQIVCAFGLTRFTPNISLGDGITSLAAVPTPVPSNPADQVAVFYRACSGPGPTDYAAGSSWTTNLASAQAQLPARGAYLGVQAQIVRAS